MTAREHPEPREPSRHELYSHPRPVITCPVCVWIWAGRIIQQKRS